MYIEKEIPVYDFVSAISEAVDMVSPILFSHHCKVAYISYRIAQKMKLAGDDIQDIILASMLHDIGAFSTGERVKAYAFDPFDAELNEHAFMGFKLLNGFEPLSKAANIIKYHHSNYERLRPDIPMGSSIIHLADKVCILLNEQREILSQVSYVLEKISQLYDWLHPDVFAAFFRLAKFEYIWLEAFSTLPNSITLKQALASRKIPDMETLRDFAKVIAQAIDFRSRFTATHSQGVAAVAYELALISGFSQRECKRMEIAGLLHDLGKLSVPNDILEKNGALSTEETNIIRKHPYYTHAVLSKIDGLEDIAAWAAHHHERQDGNGYPFHVKEGGFSKLARIMAVADILTALTENRPYRPGIDKENAMKILFNMAENGRIDKSIVELTDKYFLPVNDARLTAQKLAQKEYEAFHNVTRPFPVGEVKQTAKEEVWINSL